MMLRIIHHAAVMMTTATIAVGEMSARRSRGIREPHMPDVMYRSPTGTAKNKNGLKLQAAAKSPPTRAWKALCDPQPGQS